MLIIWLDDQLFGLIITWVLVYMVG